MEEKIIDTLPEQPGHTGAARSDGALDEVCGGGMSTKQIFDYIAGEKQSKKSGSSSEKTGPSSFSAADAFAPPN